MGALPERVSIEDLIEAEPNNPQKVRLSTMAKTRKPLVLDNYCDYIHGAPV